MKYYFAVRQPVTTVTKNGVQSGQKQQQARWKRRCQLVDSRHNVTDIKFAPRHLGLMLVRNSIKCLAYFILFTNAFLSLENAITKFRLGLVFSIKLKRERKSCIWHKDIRHEYVVAFRRVERNCLIGFIYRPLYLLREYYGCMKLQI